MSACILCGIDDSAGARRAASVASRLARDLPAQALLMQVIDERPRFPFGLRPPRLRRAQKMRRKLRAVAEEHCFPDGTGVRLESGDPVATLIAVAAEEDAELLVVAARGLGHGGAALLGGVASGLLRKAPCPVVVVPPAAIAPPDSTSMRDVVCGVEGDGGQTDLAVLKLAADLAARLGGALHAVHGYEPGELPAGAPGPQRRLNDVLHACGIDARATVVPSPPAEAIQRVAEEQRAGLVVVGARGQRGRDSMLHGSVAIELAAEGSTALVVLPGQAALEPGSRPYELTADAAWS
jgi:nucleotide-binding universal stress UspA family protein